MLKFLVFADLHYKKKMYTAPVESLEKIMERADKEGVDFVMHMGDFSNDYLGSPEIIRPYLENSYGLPVYGLYGNHELEWKGNHMENVTKCLTNRPVTFGREKETEHTGYYYTDVKGFRLVVLDTNYMYFPETDEWVHNDSDTWPFVKGSVRPTSLGSSQLRWLEETLRETEALGMKAIVFSHCALSRLWKASPDGESARKIFAKFPGTVLLAVNGHLHTDRFAVDEGVAYFDVNTVHNGFWKQQTEHHYPEDCTYSFTDYDENGVKGETTELTLRSLRQGKNTWFFTEPLSAIVTVTEDGEITVEGSETEWMYGVTPPSDSPAVVTAIRPRRAHVPADGSMKHTAYLFDFDGTLADSMPYWAEKMLNILREFDIPYPDDIIKTIAPLGDRGTAEYFRDVMGVPLSVDEMIGRMDAYALDKYANAVELKPGVREYLMRIKEAGGRLGVLTASPHRMVDVCLKRTGIYDLFDRVWSSEDFGMTKGEPKIYALAAEGLGTTVDKVAFFDDNLYAIRTSLAAGMYSVAIYDESAKDFTDELKRIADIYIDSFEGMTLV